MVATDEEREEVLRRRADEAGLAGLSVPEARAFAASGIDIGLLRWLIAHECPLEQLRRIVAT